MTYSAMASQQAAKEAAAARNDSVIIDLDVCIRCGACVDLAPGCIVWGTIITPGGGTDGPIVMEETVIHANKPMFIDAKEACPVDAIFLNF